MMLCRHGARVNEYKIGSARRENVARRAVRYNSRMTLGEFFLKQKQAIRARSGDVFRLLRPEHLAWRPEKSALSVGEMLRHLWVSEEGVRRVALDGDFTYYEKRIPGGLTAVLGGAATSLEEELRQIERVHEETLAVVSRLPAERWDIERVNDAIGFRRRVTVILFGINEHEVHHRAQLMTYLRMLGTPVPEPFAKR
ncbi:MAG: DinB family protein [Candidatus Acidiferrales bacterium]